MMTPQEVSQRAFTKASFGGYNMAQVDEFLDVLTADYTVLYKESAVLKSKMKVLVEKLEEYRATEDAMRMTLLSAQKMASAMVAEAEEKKNAALRDAEADAKQKIADIRQEIENEEYRLTATKNATVAYMLHLKELFDHEQDYLSHLSDLTAPASKPPDPVETAATEIAGSMHKLLAEESSPEEEDEDSEDTKELDFSDPPVTEGTVLNAASKDSMFQIIDLTQGGEETSGPREEPSPIRRIDFNNLQFGRDYEIK
ncbi:MAG: DivIVA domain-containing protein [Clostridia bacterium]|nr:DivIVA domain-containing protein [Clostridia bacterium]